MDTIAAIGLSWRHDDLARVALLSPSPETKDRVAAALAERLPATELVLLATCNRVEIVFTPKAPLSPTALLALRAEAFETLAGRAPTPGEAERAFRAWSGEGAVEHAFLVACGLDSARLGETEITGQVRRAVEDARDAGLIGERLSALFEEALRLARRLRAETGIGDGRTSLAELALEAVRGRVAASPHSRLMSERARVALVGVSPMTERAGRDLAADGVDLVVANRTPARAQAFVDALGDGRAGAMSLEDFVARPPAVDVVLCATASPQAVLDGGALERLAAAAPPGRPPLLIDLAVPPDVDAAAAQRFGLERVGMDELTQRAAATRDTRSEAASEARVLIDEALDRWRRTRADRALAPVLSALQTHYQATADEGLARLFRRDLSGLGPDERDALVRWARALARRFAHLPAAGLRELGAEHGRDAVESFLRRADDDLARALANGKARVHGSNDREERSA